MTAAGRGGSQEREATEQPKKRARRPEMSGNRGGDATESNACKASKARPRKRKPEQLAESNEKGGDKDKAMAASRKVSQRTQSPASGPAKAVKPASGLAKGKVQVNLQAMFSPQATLVNMLLWRRNFALFFIVPVNNIM